MNRARATSADRSARRRCPAPPGRTPPAEYPRRHRPVPSTLFPCRAWRGRFWRPLFRGSAAAIHEARITTDLLPVVELVEKDAPGAHPAIRRCGTSDDCSVALRSTGYSASPPRLALSKVWRASMRRRRWRSRPRTTTPAAIKTPMMRGAMRRMTHRPMSTSSGPSSGVSWLARRPAEWTLLLMTSQRNEGLRRARRVGLHHSTGDHRNHHQTARATEKDHGEDQCHPARAFLSGSRSEHTQRAYASTAATSWPSLTTISQETRR
jgi:hypothetical protein